MLRLAFGQIQIVCRSVNVCPRLPPTPSLDPKPMLDARVSSVIWISGEAGFAMCVVCSRRGKTLIPKRQSGDGRASLIADTATR